MFLTAIFHVLHFSYFLFYFIIFSVYCMLCIGLYCTCTAFVVNVNFMNINMNLAETTFEVVLTGSQFLRWHKCALCVCVVRQKNYRRRLVVDSSERRGIAGGGRTWIKPSDACLDSSRIPQRHTTRLQDRIRHR